VRAKDDTEADKLIEDAKLLEAAGCFAIVLEKIPRELAKKVAQSINIPTIGIGAGPDVDGQVLVLHDLLGITMDFSPRFLRRYLNLAEEIDGALKSYCDDVRSGDFPNDEESYTS
jgi:3-methyl-2-oxobutanoate hydroxymethyltransferase